MSKSRYIQDAIDAERWRTLVKSQRIRVLGSAKLGEQHQHLGLELWETYPQDMVDPKVQANNVKTLESYVDGIRERA